MGRLEPQAGHHEAKQVRHTALVVVFHHEAKQVRQTALVVVFNRKMLIMLDMSL